MEWGNSGSGDKNKKKRERESIFSHVKIFVFCCYFGCCVVFVIKYGYINEKKAILTAQHIQIQTKQNSNNNIKSK